MTQTQKDEMVARLEQELMEAETPQDVKLIKKKLKVLRATKPDV